MKVGIIKIGNLGDATMVAINRRYTLSEIVLFEVDWRSVSLSPDQKFCGERWARGVDEVRECDIAFVCMPTPPGPDGRLDTSAVDDVLSWLRVPLIVIRSTMPEFCRDHEWTTFANSPHIHVVYQPTFKESLGLVVAGGTKAAEVCDFWRPILGPETCYVATNWGMAERIRASVVRWREELYAVCGLTDLEKELLGLLGDGVRTVLANHQGSVPLAY